MHARLSLRAWCALLALSAAAGCSNYPLAHHAYAPLFDHGGQLELAASGGLHVAPNGVEGTFEARAAISPVDAFVIAAGVTGSAAPDGARRAHVDGELAFGLYLPRRRNVRAELLVGSAGGYAEGRYYDYDSDAQSGPYARPFVQGTVAGVYDDVFTWGGGLRLAGTIADLRIRYTDELGRESSGTSGVFYGIQLEPFTTFRVGNEFFAGELGLGWSVPIPGEDWELHSLNGWVSLGVRVRLDAGPDRDRPAR